MLAVALHEVEVEVEVVRLGHHVLGFLIHLRISRVMSTTVGGLLQDGTQMGPRFMRSYIFLYILLGGRPSIVA